jgi:hypothetical protein
MLRPTVSIGLHWAERRGVDAAVHFEHVVIGFSRDHKHTLAAIGVSIHDTGIIDWSCLRDVATLVATYLHLPSG